MDSHPPPSFNLWTEPWITVQLDNGDLTDVSLADAENVPKIV